MKHRLKTLGVAFSMMALSALVFASAAMAQLEVKAEDFTKPVNTQLGAAVPIIVAFLAGIFVVGFVIRWIQRRANSAK